MTSTVGIGRHPDIVAVRQDYEQADVNWAAHIITGLALRSGLYLATSPWIVGLQSLTPLAIRHQRWRLVSEVDIAVRQAIAVLREARSLEDLTGSYAS